MDDARWRAVDRYVDDLLVGTDPVLEETLASSERAGLPAISVTPSQGKLLHLLVRAVAARRVLELGTLGGYSAIWIGRALPAGGQLVTIEAKPEHAAVARANIANAGLERVVDLRVGAALDVLAELAATRVTPFDLVFIDADKPNYPHYLEATLRLSRPGTLIIADNVVRDGAVADPQSVDPMVQGARQFNALLASDARVSSTIVQTVGSKGYDGFALALVV